jgi:uncharacterized protein
MAVIETDVLLIPESSHPNVRRAPPLMTTSSAGVSLKPQHYQTILQERPSIAFFEVHAENYMCAGGPPHRYLSAIRESYPLSVHGVGLSIGAYAPLNRAHLERLKAVIDRYEPALFSEHLAWSTHAAGFLNDLLPIPYNKEALQRVVEHIDATQSFLGRRMLLENPSTYVRFAQSTFSETDFIREVVIRTGCGLLLDVNNVYVSATNHGLDPYHYLDHIRADAVAQYHLAGHTTEADEDGYPLLIDTHNRHVDDAVWSLYAYAIHCFGMHPTLIEWDDDIPEWPALLSEAELADAVATANLQQTSPQLAHTFSKDHSRSLAHV